MTISNTRFRQILREEAANSFTKQNINSFKFSKSEISALQEIRYMSINEQFDPITALNALMFLLKSSVGRKILIKILEAVKFFTGISGMIVNKIHVPILNKAIAFAEKHAGVNIPFSGEDLGKFFLNFMPDHWATLGIGKLIELLEDTSDQEFKSVINNIDTATAPVASAINGLDNIDLKLDKGDISENKSFRNRKLQIIMGR
jgi:hypothetical protein